MKDIAEKYMETLVHIDVEKKNINMVKVMDSSEFYRETGWLPKYGIQDIAEAVFIHEWKTKKA